MKPTFHTLKIKEIVRETEDSVAIEFDIPEDLKNVFQYESGQYLTLKADINEIGRASCRERV